MEQIVILCGFNVTSASMSAISLTLARCGSFNQLNFVLVLFNFAICFCGVSDEDQETQNIC